MTNKKFVRFSIDNDDDNTIAVLHVNKMNDKNKKRREKD